MSVAPPIRTERPTLSPGQIRELLQQAVLGDLLGPANGPEETIDQGTVRDRYLIGRLGPQGQRWTQPDLSPGSTEPDVDVPGELDDEESTPDVPPPQAVSMQPSALGLSFVVDGDAAALKVTARWGRYGREPGQGPEYTDEKGNQRKVWRRVPVEGVLPRLELQEGRLPAWSPSPAQPEVRVEIKVRRRTDGWHVTLFLVNGQTEPKSLKDTAWLFQPELRVEDADGQPVFVRRPLRDESDDPEVRGMNMRYRHHLEFAVGHGVSVRAVLPPGVRRQALALETQVAPVYDLPPTDPYTPPGVETDMRVLQTVPDGGFGAVLGPLVDAYTAWIDGLDAQRLQSAPDLAGYQGDAEHALHGCRETARRMQEGITVLDTNPQAAAAFRFANRAMADQRVHSLYAAAVRQGQPADLERVEADVHHHAWRTFQLAFILLNVPALTDPTHPSRGQLADLLWFPTGGGKTEAYLGVAAYTLAIRRLQGRLGGRVGEAGVAVLMRYTLRLLTLQQFQRATALICACELIRREDPVRWGNEPFRIGLWVGGSSTPNRTEEADQAVRALRDQRFFGGSTPHQLTNCPWCGAPINPGRHIEVESHKAGRGRTWVYCGDDYGQCAFSKALSPGEGLPVLTVDEEIYARLPALLIATVDKFAQMPWNGRVAMLFGQVDGYCERHGFRSPEIEDAASHPAKGTLPRARTLPHGPLRPPDLIIQDELHLISGPLGTMVGLYEGAVDRLASWELDGVTVQPKIIASTATVRRAGGQVSNLFARQVNIFPAQGLDVEDNFFARQTPVDAQHPGRRYLGIYAPGVRHRAALIRVYTAFLSAARYLYEVFGGEEVAGEEAAAGLGLQADPWMTLVGYFNSLRELGSMKRAVDDSVTIRLRRMDRARRPGLAGRNLSPYSVQELTSRRSATQIPEILDQLETPFDPAVAAAAQKSGRPRKGDADPKNPLDVLLATNMISVGVDVSRLGLMVVAGQPKNTAEYIQATSRVGRRFPGLVCTVYNWTRPRDISHYERFLHYHATFYQHVEALSVTPFAPRALERGLSAALVALVRLAGLEFNANAGAGRVSRSHAYVQNALATLVERAAHIVDVPTANEVRQAAERRLDVWMHRRETLTGSQLGYKDARDAQTVGLLRYPDRGEWAEFTCLNSLRDVEPMVNLVLNEYGMDRDEARAWPVSPPRPVGTAGSDAAGQDDVDDDEQG